VHLRRRLRPADPEHEDGRHDEAERVEEDRERRADEADQDARQPWPGDLRRGARDLELRVALDELVALDERRQVALVGDVEEDGQAAGDEADDVQLPDRQCVEGECDRDRDEGGGAAKVADDEDRPST
jgi:hypothetical protein